MTISTQDVDDLAALREASRGDLLALLAAVDQHRPLWEQSRNLGYYRTEVDCTCGATLWYGGHDEDPDWLDVWDAHRAEDIEKRGVRVVWPAPVSAGVDPAQTQHQCREPRAHDAHSWRDVGLQQDERCPGRAFDDPSWVATGIAP